jgi:inosose dehydratase
MSAQILLANAPVSWGIMEVDGWSPPIAWPRVMDEIAGSGYAATELGPYGYYPTDAAGLRAELQRRSLALTSAFVPLRLKDPGGVKTELPKAVTVGRLLADCGARYLVLSDHMWPERMACAGWVPEAGLRLTAADWKVVAQNIRQIAAAARDLGLRCVFHHHVGTYVETPGEVDIVLNEVDSADLGLCLDTGHYFYGGGDPVEAVKKYGRRVEYLHFKDVNPQVREACRRERLGFLDGVRRGVFCPLGQGGVDFPALKQELDALNYQGVAVVEQDVDANDTSGPPAVEGAKASLAFLRRLGV